MGNVYKILITGVLIFELFRFRVFGKTDRPVRMQRRDDFR